MSKKIKRKATEFDVDLGKTIRSLRNERKMTQEGLAGKLGISFQQLQKNERGVNRFPPERLFDLSKIFEVSPLVFFPDTEYGTVPTLTKQEWELIGACRNIIDLDDKSFILKMAKRFAGE